MTRTSSFQSTDVSYRRRGSWSSDYRNESPAGSPSTERPAPPHRRHSAGSTEPDAIAGAVSLPSVVEQAGLVSEDGGLGAVGDVELGEQPRHVGLDGGLADEQRAACLCVGLSATDEYQDLEFPVRQDPQALAGCIAKGS